MKHFQLKIILASCYIFSTLANDILICKELTTVVNSVCFWHKIKQCSIKQHYCLLHNATPKSIIL